MEISDKFASQIHGIISSDSDSDFENTKDFDEEYNSLKPPPIEYESIRDKIIVISRCEETNNEKETFETISEMTLVTNKKKKKSKQKNINVNEVKPNQNKGNIAAVDSHSAKLSKSDVSVSQAKKKSKTTLQSKTNNSSTVKCVSIQNLKASKDLSQVQTKKASNSSKKKKKQKSSVLENNLQNSKQSKNQNNSSIKCDNFSNLTNKHEVANIGANKIMNSSKKKNKKLKKNLESQVDVAINKNESLSINIYNKNNMSLTDMSTKKKGKSKKKSKQSKSEVNTGGERSTGEMVDSNLAVTPKQTLNCTEGVQEPACLAPENEDGMVPVLVIKYKGDNKNLPKRTKKWIQSIVNQDFDGELEKTVTKRLGAKETLEKLSDPDPDDNYIIIRLRQPNLNSKNENTKQNWVLPENEVFVRKAGSKNKNTVKQVLLKQTQIATSNLVSQDCIGCLEKTNESVRGAGLGHKQILKTVIEGQQTLNNQVNFKLLGKEITEPENENVIIKEVTVTNVETQNKKRVKPVLLKQLQIDTFDRVAQDTTAHPEKAIETFGKNLVFRIEIKGKQVPAGIKKECKMIFIRASMTRDNLKTLLLKQLKISPLDLTGQNRNGDVEETIGYNQISNRILKRQETFQNYFNLNDVQETLIFEIHMNSSTKKTIAIPWKYNKDTKNKTLCDKIFICLKDFQGSFQVSGDVVMKLISRQYGPIYSLIYERMINRENWPENKNMLMNISLVETEALWRSRLQISTHKFTLHEEKNILTVSSNIDKEVYDNNCKSCGNGDYKCTTCVLQITGDTDSASSSGTSVCDKISGLKDQKIGHSGTAIILTDLDDNVNNTHDRNVLRDNKEWGHSTEFVDDSREVDFSNDEVEGENVDPEIETDSLGSRLCHMALVVTLAYLVVSLIAKIALFLLYNIFFLSVILVLYFYMKS